MRHPQKGLILISKTTILKAILDTVYGFAQWVHPDVIEKHKDVFKEHDSKIEDNEGRKFILVGPIAIAAHRCKGSLRFCMSDEWLKTLKSPEQKLLVQVNLEKWRKEGLNLKPDDEISIYYGEGGVENCCCEECINTRMRFRK